MNGDNIKIEDQGALALPDDTVVHMKKESKYDMVKKGSNGG